MVGDVSTNTSVQCAFKALLGLCRSFFRIFLSLSLSFAAFALVSVLWIIYGYTFTFGDDLSGLIGNPVKPFLSGISINSVVDVAKTIPEYIFIVYQLTFAAITVALASGAFIERMKFSAWIIFTILWMSFVYVPIAHWVWGGGFLAKLGALDFAGGTVVHINAGIAALIGVLLLGKRRDAAIIPHNLTMVATGTGLLWFGWFGFNAGSALSANGIAGAAFINTNTAAATDTFMESMVPRMGMTMEWVAAWSHSSVRPVDSVPTTIAVGRE